MFRRCSQGILIIIKLIILVATNLEWYYLSCNILRISRAQCRERNSIPEWPSSCRKASTPACIQRPKTRAWRCRNTFAARCGRSCPRSSGSRKPIMQFEIHDSDYWPTDGPIVESLLRRNAPVTAPTSRRILPPYWGAHERWKFSKHAAWEALSHAAWLCYR